MKRFLVLLVAVGALVGLAAAWLPSPAATVDGTTISRQSLNADLTAVSGDSGFQCYLQAELELGGGNASGLFPVTGAGPGTGTSTPTYNANFVAYWLGLMEQDVLVAHELAARHLSVTSGDLAIGRATLTEQVTSILADVQSQSGSTCAPSASALLGTLPPSFYAEQVLGQARRDVLEAHEAGYALSTSGVARYYAAHQSDFDKECISYVSFASKTAAAAALAAIDAGTTSISQTGTLTQIGCGPKIGITSLPASVVDLAVGKVSQPVAERTGSSAGTMYALLVITSRSPTPLAAIRATARQVMLSSGLTRTQAVVGAAVRQAQVTVDPRYGRVGPGSALIDPPSSPAEAFVLNPQAALPPALKAPVASHAAEKPASRSPASG